MLKLWKTPVLNNKVLFNNIRKRVGIASTQAYKFSAAGGSGHSGSETEHDVDHHEDGHHKHHEHPLVTEGNYEQEARSRIFNRQETFSVETLLNKLKEPLVQITNKPDQSVIQVHKSEKEYIDFLAVNFEKKALEKYPEYKTYLEEFQHLIPNYESLNAYQREVYTLDTYLHWQLELDELKIREAYNFTGTPLERGRQRFAYFQNLITDDHHHDTRISHHLKEKLREVLQGELEYEEFRHDYNETIEKQLLENLVEKRKKTFYYDIVQNKVELERHLNDLNSPGNKHKFTSSITPHDHIHPQHFSKNPEKMNEERFNYLAYFDLITDQHLRQVRPSSISERDEMFKYVKDEFKPLRVKENDITQNMYHEYLYTLDNEFYVKFKESVQKTLLKMDIPIEVEDKNHPLGKLWKDEHKFPHVADRLGWDFLQETPLDKNPLIERVESHPLYQWQPFVQTPSWEPNKDLCLEQGETIYENKWVFEWVLFWRCLTMLVPVPIYWFLYESYNNNTANSPEYSGRFSFYIHPFNSASRGLPRRMPELINYWGSNLWLWQHWVRKGLIYFALLGVAALARKGFKWGHEYVVKAVYNREKDLVFVWRPTGFLTKQLHIYELHYLEQTVPRITSAWNNLGNFKKDGIFTVYDLRLNHDLFFYNENKYWNVDERSHFFKNTTTFWRGLRHKDVDRGIFFNNSNVLTQEEIVITKKINEEVKSAVEKHGPLQVTDYEFNYKYQLKKRVQDMKRHLIEGRKVDTSIFREPRAGRHYGEHDILSKPALH